MANLSFVRSSKLIDLLQTADPQKEMYVRVLSASRLALGIDPLQPTHLIDLSKENIRPYHSLEPSKTFEQILAPSVQFTPLN